MMMVMVMAMMMVITSSFFVLLFPKVFFGFPFKDTSARWRKKKTGKASFPVFLAIGVKIVAR